MTKPILSLSTILVHYPRTIRAEANLALVLWGFVSRPCFSSLGVLHVVGDDSGGIVHFNFGEQRVAVDIASKAQISRLERARSKHEDNVDGFLKKRFGSDLNRVRKGRNVLQVSINSNIRAQAEWAEIFWNRKNDNVYLFIAKVNVSLSGNDGIAGVENKCLDIHQPIVSFQV